MDEARGVVSETPEGMCHYIFKVTLNARINMF